MKIIVINGPPCSGKSTILENLVSDLECPFFSLGSFLNKISETNKLVKKYKDSGRVRSIPYEIIVPLVEEYFRSLREADHKLCIFQRGPWCENLANLFEGSGVSVDLFIEIEVDEKVLLERKKYRRIDPKTSRIYNINEEKIDSKILKRLRVKFGDTDDLFRKRILRYRKKSHQLIEYYRIRNRLRIVDGNDCKLEVLNSVLKYVKLCL